METIQEQMRGLLQKHCLTIKKNVEELGQHIAGLSKPDGNPLEAAITAEALAHQLKGGSGTIGFQNISVAATALDDHLKLLCRKTSAEIITRQQQTNDLYTKLKEIAAALTPESSSLFNADLSAFAKRKS